MVIFPIYHVFSRLSDSRGKDDIHMRAKKLKEHYKAVQACDQIMAYGFVIIMFLLTGFYWFIIIFNEEIITAFHVTRNWDIFTLMIPYCVYFRITIWLPQLLSLEQ